MIDHNLTVALINVVIDGDYQYEQELPLGVASIGAYLRGKGYDVVFRQCFASRGDTELEFVSQQEADVYGFQINMVNYTSVVEFVKRLKERKPEALIVVGGPFLANLYEDILKKQPLIDFIILGEGEVTFLELLKDISKGADGLSEINGLVWRNKQGDIVKNSLRSLIDDIDTLPFPARDFLEEARHDPVDNGLLESVRMVTSRGCIGRCSFCCVNLFNEISKGKVWRGRSPEKVVDEIEYLSKTYRAKLFNFSDSSFEDPGEPGKQRAKEICEGIINRNIPFSAKVYMRCETMKTEKDIELLKLYKKAGIDVVIIGAEAGSDYELELYEKRATLEDNYRTAKLLKELDLFFVFVGFIMFGPNSTVDIIKENMNFLYKCGFAENLMSIHNTLLLIRGSKLYDRLKSEGRVIENNNYWEFPKYTFRDQNVERAAKYWQTIFKKQPITYEVNKLQVNMGNVVYRMTNPMNAGIMNKFEGDYEKFKERAKTLFNELGQAHYEHFNCIINLISNNCSDDILEKTGIDFFTKDYIKLFNDFGTTYNSFLDKIERAGFAMSGLVFRHFINANFVNNKIKY